MAVKRTLRAPSLLCALAAVLAWLSVHQVSVLRQAEAWLEDLGLAYVAQPLPQFAGIVVLAIDEDTLAELPFRSPIDRSFLTELVRELGQRNVRALGIDVIFDQPTVPDEDAALRAAIDAFPAPVVVAHASYDAGLTPRQRAFQAEFSGGWTRGAIDVYMTDGVVRHVYPRGPGADGEIPSFPVALASALGVPEPAGPLRVRFRARAEGGLPAIRKFPAHELAALPAQWFDDAIVLIGADLPNQDRFRTPLAVLGADQLAMPGVEIHAQALAQLLEGTQYPSIGAWAAVAILLAATVIGSAIVLMRINLGLKILGGVAVVGSYWALAFAALASSNVQLPLLAPTLGLLLGAGFVSAYGRSEEARQKRFLRRAFERYVSPSIINEVVRDPDKLALGGEQREMSFVFSDLSGFTSMMEKLSPSVTVALLQDYFRGMLDIALELGGTVERMIGDSILVFFGAPGHQPDHARRAVICALEWDKYCERFRHDQLARGIPMGVTRIGMHTGLAMVGNVGTADRFHYTAHGDSVNIAARLESANKHLGTRTCLSTDAARHYPEGDFRPVGRILLKGKAQPIDCVTIDGDLPGDMREEYRTAYALMQANDRRCVEMFARLYRRMPQDTLVGLHTSRLGRGEISPIIVLEEK